MKWTVHPPVDAVAAPERISPVATLLERHCLTVMPGMGADISAKLRPFVADQRAPVNG